MIGGLKMPKKMFRIKYCPWLRVPRLWIQYSHAASVFYPCLLAGALYRGSSVQYGAVSIILIPGKDKVT